MKKILALSIVSLFLLILVGCGDDIAVSAPENFTIAAATNEVDVILDWDENTDEIDGYYVYFKTAVIGTVTTAGYTHVDPQETGDYYVTAYLGEDESDPSSTATTTPVIADNITLAEINAAGNSGLGWSRTDGSATTYTMEDASNASFIDFYFSDWATGSQGPDYQFISPTLVETDPGVTWTMSGTWNLTAFTIALTDDFNDIVLLPSSGYSNSQLVDTYMATYGVYTTDGYFAMVEVKSANTGTGEIEIRVAFQPVQGLRILEH